MPAGDDAIGSKNIQQRQSLGVTGSQRRGAGRPAEERPAREVAVFLGEIAPIGLLSGKIVLITGASRGIADAATVDLADPASIRTAVERVDELHGRLDGAFNNGAASQQPGPLDATSDEDTERPGLDGNRRDRASGRRRRRVKAGAGWATPDLC